MFNNPVISFDNINAKDYEIKIHTNVKNFFELNYNGINLEINKDESKDPTVGYIEIKINHFTTDDIDEIIEELAEDDSRSKEEVVKDLHKACGMKILEAFKALELFIDELIAYHIIDDEDYSDARYIYLSAVMNYNLIKAIRKQDKKINKAIKLADKYADKFADNAEIAGLTLERYSFRFNAIKGYEPDEDGE